MNAEPQRCRDAQVAYATLLLADHPEQRGLRQAFADEFAEDLILSGLWECALFDQRKYMQ